MTGRETRSSVVEDLGLRKAELLRHMLLRSVFLELGSHFGCRKRRLLKFYTALLTS